MNRLLGSLGDLGYIVRNDAQDEGRARIVHFTKRGHAAYAKALEVLRDIEREWRAELGPKDFAQLKELLCRVWESTVDPLAVRLRGQAISAEVPGCRANPRLAVTINVSGSADVEKTDWAHSSSMPTYHS
jgi:hypothetical protein